MSELRQGYFPGAIGELTALHGTFYHQALDFGLAFEAHVATGFAEFLGRLDPARDGFWSVHEGGQLAGALAVDGGVAPDEGACLRWFIVSAERRGQGVGSRLLDAALEFCRGAGYGRAFLWTLPELETALRLYEGKGFVRCGSRETAEPGRAVTMIQMELALATGPGGRAGRTP